MKFVAIRQGARTGLAVQDAGGSLRGRYQDEAQYPGNLDLLVRHGEAATRQAGMVLSASPTIDSSTITYLPPLLDADKIVCIGLNYVDHNLETGNQPVSYPGVFARFNSSLIGHGATIALPPESRELDYEGELVAVIGQGGRRIERDAALNHVAGYSIFNDASLRDIQMKSASKQWTMGKNFDRTGAFGPAFVTADELPPGAAGLRLQTRLNGTVVQTASTKDLMFDVASLIELLSAVMTLSPGDLIVTGTPGGVGMFRKPPLWMKHGDVCEVEIEGIGILRNQIVAE